VWLGSRDPLNFLALNANSSEMVKATDFKFDVHVSKYSMDMTTYFFLKRLQLIWHAWSMPVRFTVHICVVFCLLCCCSSSLTSSSCKPFTTHMTRVCGYHFSVSVSVINYPYPYLFPHQSVARERQRYNPIPAGFPPDQDYIFLKYRGNGSLFCGNLTVAG